MSRHLIRSIAVALVTCVACGTASPAEQPAKPTVTLDRATQRLLEKYGIAAAIVRPWDELRDTPESGDKGFPILLPGQPSVRLVLERDYWAVAIEKTKDLPASYVLNPKDEQSALNISVGEGGLGFSDEDRAKEPGFTEMKRESGTIANRPVVWRRWSDKKHFHSACTVLLPAIHDMQGKEHLVKLKVTANTQERRTTLESQLELLELIYLTTISGNETPNAAIDTGKN
jgi:hypothetical protein